MNPKFFPTPQEIGPLGDVIDPGQPGVSLRDYFAAHAPQPRDPMDLDQHAAYRFRYADAMMRARGDQP